MIDDLDEDDKTPTATPNAKKSSGEWKLGLVRGDAQCARCQHMRDEHFVDEEMHAVECMVVGCECQRFFVGGVR